ncbi:MAG: shikimate kinase [Candidatus Izemoplasmatales bacterium]|nr:shikimate kinase [Candidatus Izemoplasmatales bacterium]
MHKIKTILIFGASGSGSTTLARAISQKYGFHFIDTDDAIWEQTNPPFKNRRESLDSWKILNDQLSANDFNVISGSFIGWGDSFKNKIDLFIYMNLPLEIRLKRIQIREENRFGGRVLPGGDLYLQHLDFLNWVSMYEILDETKRSQKQHEKWLQNVKKDILYIKEPLTITELLAKVSVYFE